MSLIKKKLESSKNVYDKLALQYFNIMAGPFDRLDHQLSLPPWQRHGVEQNTEQKKTSSQDFMNCMCSNKFQTLY